MRFLSRSGFLHSTYRKFAFCLYASTVRSMHIERANGTITISPKNEAHQSALIVISHGLGDTAEGFADVAEVRDRLILGNYQWPSGWHWLVLRLYIATVSCVAQGLGVGFDRCLLGAKSSSTTHWPCALVDKDGHVVDLYWGFSGSHSSPLAICKENAIRQDYLANSPNATCDYEHGHGDALMVSYYSVLALLMMLSDLLASRYDITGLDERSNEKCKGLPESVQRLAGILKTEHETNGLPYSRMVLAGFSQGGALSLFTGFSLPQKLAGIVCMSGYLPAASQFKITPGLESTPVLHCHGTQDMVVSHTLAAKSRGKIMGYGATDYTIESYPIGHTVSMEEVCRVEDFLKMVLPDDPSFRVKLKDPSEMSVKELKQAIRQAGLSAVGLMEKSEFIKMLKDHREKL